MTARLAGRNGRRNGVGLGHCAQATGPTAAFLFAWTLQNAYLLQRDAFDFSPPVLSDLMPSPLAAFQAPVFMMPRCRRAMRAGRAV
jgi:uncharacterized membrane protein